MSASTRGSVTWAEEAAEVSSSSPDMRSRKKNRRILVIDDNRALHDDIRKSLSVRLHAPDTRAIEDILFGDDAADASSPGQHDMDAAKAAIATSPAVPSVPDFEITSAYQGAEGLELVRRAVQQGRQFALAIVDIRIPPGWDGIETLSRLWQEDPGLQAIICSAYSDYSWEKIASRLVHSDRFMFLRKPFDTIEIRQMACALTERWNQDVELMASAESLRRSEARNRALIDAIPDAILRLDGNGRCLEFKPAQETAAGVLLRESAASLEAERKDKLALQLAGDVRRALETGALQVSEFQEIADGQARHYEARTAVLGDGGALSVVRDMTRLKQAAEEAAHAQAREAALLARADVLEQLAMPLIPIDDRVVVMPLIGDLDARRVLNVRLALLPRIHGASARVVILDLTGTSSLDAQAAEEIVLTAQAVQLLGAQLILTGLGSHTAQQLVSIGASLRGIITRQTLQDGIRYAMKHS